MPVGDFEGDGGEQAGTHCCPEVFEQFLRDFLDWSSRPVVHARDRARRATALAVLEARASELLGEEKADGR